MGIYIKGFKPQDGLYQIHRGMIWKYKGEGRTVRPYEMVEVKEPNEMERVIGVCVKGMKMPKSCMRCDFAYWSNLQQAYLCDKSDNEIVSGKDFMTKRASFCPLIEIETPNGEQKEYRQRAYDEGYKQGRHDDNVEMVKYLSEYMKDLCTDYKSENRYDMGRRVGYIDALNDVHTAIREYIEQEE